MPAPSKISDCMRRNPLTIHLDANLVQAIETIVEYKLTGLTVTDDEGNAVGILSELRPGRWHCRGGPGHVGYPPASPPGT